MTRAQSSDCPVIVETALKTTEQVCSGTGRDQACYGNMLVDAQAQSGLGPLTFQQPGDIVDLVALRSLNLSPMDVEEGVWGLARLELRANLSPAQPKNVTLLMFGNVQVNNAVTPTPSLEVANAIGQNVNVRLTPSDKAGVIGTLAAEQKVEAIGRLPDSSWLRVKLPESGETGWVYAPFFASEGDVNTLAVVAAKSAHFEPMQAFYFSSGVDETPACATMPASGMLIQTPEGAGKVTLLINEVKINIGSTVYFTAQAGGEMTITTLEGAADVEVEGISYTAYAGTTVTVPLSENLTPTGAPNPPVPYTLEPLEHLPVDILSQHIDLLPPLTTDEIIQLLAADQGNANGRDDCPGQSCNAPGHGGTCPGNSCDNPGQGDGNGKKP